ncbi:MAG TPA: hypothetical protein VIM39_07010, partial [Candidatus Limnocylindrales bacterium]
MSEPTATGSARKPASTTKTRPKRKARRRPIDPALAWARRLVRYRPGLLEDTLDALAELYGRPVWERRLDPTSELILTILT